ncbi:MAG: zinc-binding dehydrogenase, partial [Mycobacterium sp.]
VGINAVQGARIAGAQHIVGLDPVEFKRDKSLEFGATHTAGTVEEAAALVAELTRGQMADVCVVTTDVAEGQHVAPALSLVGKRGRVVITAIGHPTETTAAMSVLDLTLYEKQVRGSLFGSSNPRDDIFELLSLYDNGQLKLDELITREYTLDEVNQGYDDMLSGRNLRGLIRY